MAVHATTFPRTDVWHGRFGPTLALLLVTIPFAVALVWIGTLPRGDPATIARDIQATATMIDDHGATMVRVGERMAAAAAVSTASDRAAWAAYAQHVISDGRSMTALAERLRSAAAFAAATDPSRASTSVAVAVQSARWRELRADGAATASHGRLMSQMAGDLGPGVAAGILSPGDVSDIMRASSGMVEAGERIVRSADMSLGSLDQVRQWMGW